MAKSCFDYPGYGYKWLKKSDLTPNTLKKYGINVNTKQIKNHSFKAVSGYVYTGGHGYSKKVNCYSIDSLKKIFNKI